LILNHHLPDDYIIGTGKAHSVRDFLSFACTIFDINYEDFYELNKEFYREAEKYPLLADISKIKKQLNWKPKTSFQDIVKIMIENDLKELTS
jgi:GDPmannose 4,6-dehydratase